MTSVSTHLENIATLKTFKVGQNVFIQDFSKGSKAAIDYGVIVDFILNCFDELCVSIRIFSSEGEEAEIRHFHPKNETVRINIV